MSIITSLLAKKETKEYFLLLALEEHRIQAAICQLSGNVVTIKGTGESEFVVGGNEIEAADIAISMAEKTLPNTLLAEKVVFAVPQSFLSDDKIRPEKLLHLKKITKELNLVPHGFIEYPSAISFHLEKEDASPPTLLLIHVTSQQLIFSLFRVGKIQQNIIVPRTSTLSSDFEAAMPQFNAEILPSRIMLYDESTDEQLEILKEELLRFPWNKYSIFLHTPKIEIFPHDKVIFALVEAAAGSFMKTFTPEQTAETEKEEPSLPKTKEESQETNESFGFVKEKEAVSEKEKKTEEIPDQLSRPVMKTEVAENIIIPQKPAFAFPKLSFSLPQFPISSLAKTFLPLIGTVAIFFLLLYYLLGVYPKAIIYLIVYPQTATQQMKVTFTTKESKNEPGGNAILATPISDEITGSKTMVTTGKNNIGEKASGEVVIYNKTVSSKTFPKGTILQTGDLKFTLDNDGSIASASDTGEGLSFGKTTAKVTAYTIGPESNISDNHAFTFKDFPQTSYTAKNNSAFSGGTSREVASVSSEDQSELEKSLTNELISKVKQQSFTKIPAGEKLISSLITTNATSKKFSSGIGSEAKELTLTLTIKISTYSYKEDDLAAIAQQSLPTAPTGFTLDSKRTNIMISETKIDKNGQIEALTNITAYFLPEVENDKIKAKLTGKTYQQAASILETTKSIAGVRIVKETDLPFFGNRLPFSSNNITLQVAAN